MVRRKEYLAEMLGNRCRRKRLHYPKAEDAALSILPAEIGAKWIIGIVLLHIAAIGKHHSNFRMLVECRNYPGERFGQELIIMIKLDKDFPARE